MSDTASVGPAEEQQAEQRLREFIQRQHQSRLDANGVVTGKDVCHILESLGLPFEETEVRPLLPEWDNVSAEAALEAATTVRITHNAELDHMVQRMEEGTIRLSLFEYIKYKLPFTAKDPDWQHRTIVFSLDLAPRQVLFISTGVVLLVAGMSILLLMSLLWLNQANDREEVQMENFHLLLHSFAESFEQRFLDVHAATMVDEADTLAKMVEHQHSLRLADLNAEFREEAAMLAAVANVAANEAQSALIDPEVSLIAALAASLFPAAAGVANASLSELEASVRGLNADMDIDEGDLPWEHTLALHDPNTGAFDRILVEAPVLDCSYGPCDYAAVPCIAQSTGPNPPSASNVVVMDDSLDVRREPAIAVARRLDGVMDGSTVHHVTICSTLPVVHRRLAREQGMALAVSTINAELTGPLLRRREVMLAHWANASAQNVEWATPLLRVPGPCYRNFTCNGLDVLASQALLTQATVTQVVTGYTGTDMLAAAAPTEDSDLAVLLNVPMGGVLEEERDQIVGVANRMNAKSGIQLEVSIGRRDPTTQAILPQLTEFRNADACLRPCERTDAASVAATSAITTESAGYLIAPNYQPVAVLASYAYVGQGVDLSIVVERSVASIRTVAIQSLISIFDSNNRASGKIESQLVQYIGAQPTKSFDPAAACDYIRDCERDDDIGVLYRSDCVHCNRLEPAVAQRRVQSLTALKFQDECDDVRNCTTEGLAENPPSLWRTVLERQNTEQELFTDVQDYRFENVLAVTSFVQNLSVGIIVKIDKKETEGPILERIGYASGIALGVVIVGLFVLIVFSRKVLDRIEHEWLTYKEQIDAEKKKFDSMVQDVLPARVSEELHKNQKMAMPVASMSFVFLDVVGMSDRTKNWAPELVCRFVTYTFTVIDRVCSHYSLNKVRVFGDTYFAVGGLGESTTEEHCVFRTACFGSVVVQLLGPKYAHFPDRVPLIHDTFDDFVAKNGPVFPDVSDNPTDVGHIAMPPMRLGMNYGIGTFCIIETGRTPAYEVFGPGVALAARMQSTSQANRLHMSGAMKEVLERLDKDRLFEYDPPRKTVVKGQGSVASFFVRSASVRVPDEVLKPLGIEHANRRVYYEGDAAAPPSATPGAPTS
jgi:class 3 adenylate cyclase